MTRSRGRVNCSRILPLDAEAERRHSRRRRTPELRAHAARSSRRGGWEEVAGLHLSRVTPNPGYGATHRRSSSCGEPSQPAEHEAACLGTRVSAAGLWNCAAGVVRRSHVRTGHAERGGALLVDGAAGRVRVAPALSAAINTRARRTRSSDPPGHRPGDVAFAWSPPGTRPPRAPGLRGQRPANAQPAIRRRPRTCPR